MQRVRGIGVYKEGRKGGWSWRSMKGILWPLSIRRKANTKDVKEEEEEKAEEEMVSVCMGSECVNCVWMALSHMATTHTLHLLWSCDTL
jgi:hypothetical protein